MEAIEFRAIVEDGIIRVPAEYRSRLTKPVRVIVLADEDTEQKPMKQKPIIDHLLEHPRRVEGFRPLARKNIYE